MDEDGEEEPPHGRNAPDDPAELHWLIVSEIVADLRAVLRSVAKGKKWEQQARHIQLGGVAQAAMVVSSFPVRQDESPEHKKLRLAAKHFEQELIANHQRTLERARGDADLTRYLVEQFEQDIASPRRHSHRNLECPITLIGRAVIDAIALVNVSHAYLPSMPTGFDAESVTVELVSAALRHTSAQSSLENVRWALEERFAARRQRAKPRSQTSSARRQRVFLDGALG